MQFTNEFSELVRAQINAQNVTIYFLQDFCHMLLMGGEL